MLPLRPPSEENAPAYPTRQRLCADDGLSRRALAILAAAALSGCGQSQSTAPLDGGTQPRQGGEPTALPGVPPMPQQQGVDPEPEPLAGEVMPVDQPEPYQLRGKMIPVQEPEPVPLVGDIAPVQLPEPTGQKLGGVMIAPPPKTTEPQTPKNDK